MAIDSMELENRLKNWAQEYGGGRYPNVGWQGRNLIQTLIEHKGFVPSSRGYIPVPIRSAADEVEKIVRDMEQSDMARQASALRCDYFMPNIPVSDRLRRMTKRGHPMSRAAYYDVLSQGKSYLRGALSRAEAA